MNVLIDVCLSPLWQEDLTEAGHNAIHWSEVGPVEANDSEVLSWARDSGFIVFTHDLDFGTILAATGADAPSVLQLREQDTDPEVVGQAVLAAITQCESQLEAGALVSVDLRRAKARILLIRREGE